MEEIVFKFKRLAGSMNRIGILWLGWFLLIPEPSLASWWTHQINSSWRKQPIVIDGDDYDWRGVEFDEYKNFMISFFNDRTDLYLYLGTKDRATQAQLTGLFHQKFTIGLNLDSKGNPSCSVRFSFKEHHPYMNGQFPVNYSKSSNLSEILEQTEIFRPGPGLSGSDQSGVQVSIGAIRKEIFYEMKIPLQAIEPLRRLGLIEIELETDPLDPQMLEKIKEKIKEQNSRINASGPRKENAAEWVDSPHPVRGSGRRGRGPGTQRRGEELLKIPKPFKIQLKVKLASEPLK